VINHKARDLQLERKSKYFMEWVEDQTKVMKNPKAREKVKEMLLLAYLRGRGDTV